MATDSETIRDLYTDAGELRGVWTRGGDPKQLVLSDGSRLELSEGRDGPVLWRHSGPDGERPLSVGDARKLAGEGFARFVEVRTRSEAGWLRVVSDRCRVEAERLEGELAGSAARA